MLHFLNISNTYILQNLTIYNAKLLHYLIIYHIVDSAESGLLII